MSSRIVFRPLCRFSRRDDNLPPLTLLSRRKKDANTRDRTIGRLLQEGASVIKSKTHGHLCLLGPAQTCRSGLLSHRPTQRPPLAADAADSYCDLHKQLGFCRKARQLSSQKPMAARGHVNGRGPAKLGGMSEAKVFESITASLEAKAISKAIPIGRSPINKNARFWPGILL